LLHERATQTVFGRGPEHARIMLIGEQPGDQEDLRGEPFVGPAGQVLEDALVAAQLSRDEIYLTNAVKHFHWEPRGKRRMHQKPPARAVTACRPWLDAEFQAVAPQVVICLGATAAQALLGHKEYRRRTRGQFFASAACQQTLITWHPAAILRAPDRAEQVARTRELTDHLKVAAAACLA
jgi:DNA polymerase